MTSIVLFQAREEASNNAIYRAGYEVGYFIGSNFYAVMAVAVLVLMTILYFAFFRRRKKEIL